MGFLRQMHQKPARQADLGGQPVIALLPAGQHQQVLADRVGHAQLRFGQAQGQLGAVQGAQAGLASRLGEPDDAVQAVMRVASIISSDTTISSLFFIISYLTNSLSKRHNGKKTGGGS